MAADYKLIKEIVQRTSTLRKAAEEAENSTEGRMKAAERASRRIDGWMTRMAEGSIAEKRRMEEAVKHRDSEPESPRR